MFKFVHKNHMRATKHESKIVIYYSLSDIVLGFLLVVLVAFFIYNYLEVNFYVPARPILMTTVGVKPPVIVTKPALKKNK